MSANFRSRANVHTLVFLICTKFIPNASVIDDLSAAVTMEITDTDIVQSADIVGEQHPPNPAEFFAGFTDSSLLLPFRFIYAPPCCSENTMRYSSLHMNRG